MESIKHACRNVKSMVAAPVVGHRWCRRFYYLLVVIAAVLFARLAYRTIVGARSHTITTASFVLAESVPFPVLWACVQSGLPILPTSRFDAVNGSDACTVGNTNNGEGEIWAKGMVSYTSGAFDCGFWRSNTSFTRILERTFRKTSGQGLDVVGWHGRLLQHNYACKTFNEAGMISDSAANPKVVWLEWLIDKSKPVPFDDYVRVGFMDHSRIPNLENHPDALTLVKSYPIGMGSEASLADMSMQTIIDQRDPTLWEAAKSFFKVSLGMTRPRRTTNTYTAQFSQYDSPQQGQSSVAFRMRSYDITTYTKRYETFDEVWAALGGGWAACALILAMFFMRKTAAPHEGNVVNHDVMVPRLQDNMDLESLVAEELCMAGQVAAASGYHNDFLVAAANASSQVVAAEKELRSDDFKEALLPAEFPTSSRSDESDSDSS